MFRRQCRIFVRDARGGLGCSNFTRNGSCLVVVRRFTFETLRPEAAVEEQKRQWVAPEIRKYGSFEAATQTCIKALGSSDGFTFQGNTVPIHWCAS